MRVGGCARDGRVGGLWTLVSSEEGAFPAGRAPLCGQFRANGLGDGGRGGAETQIWVYRGIAVVVEVVWVGMVLEERHCSECQYGDENVRVGGNAITRRLAVDYRQLLDTDPLEYDDPTYPWCRVDKPSTVCLFITLARRAETRHAKTQAPSRLCFECEGRNANHVNL